MTRGWEQRWHPFRREWVVYAAHRNTRPWSGAGLPTPAPRPAYDPGCYLCPGNRRVHGSCNPDYGGIHVFDNDHPVVGEMAPGLEADADPVFRRAPARGCARVMCFSPAHDRHFRDFTPDEAAAIALRIREEIHSLRDRPGVRSVLYFENRGEITGTSNPHPHGQLYGVGFVFRHVEQECEAVAAYRAEHGRSLCDDWMERELRDGRRVVAQNEHAVAILPFFARYPFEVWVLPRVARARLSDCTEPETAALGLLYREVCRTYDRLFDRDFPYVCSLYEAPADWRVPGYRLHFTFLPPLRRPDLQKFPAGPEIGGGNFMNDTLPEDCAARLRGESP